MCWECRVIQLLGDMYGGSSEKLKIELPPDLAALLLGTYLKEDICVFLFISALFTIGGSNPDVQRWING